MLNILFEEVGHLMEGGEFIRTWPFRGIAVINPPEIPPLGKFRMKIFIYIN